MNNLIDLILEPLKEVYLKFAAFFPNLLAMLIITLTGIFAARIIRSVLLRLLKMIRFDNWSDRMGLTAVMRKGDVWAKPSTTLGDFLFWLLVIVFFMAGLAALKVDAIDKLVSQFVLYLPRVVSVVLILVFGYIITGFIGRAVLITVVNKGYNFAKVLVEAVRILLIMLFVAMALEQLNVAPGIVVAAFSIIFGGVVLALAIAFGIGGVEAARRLLEKEADMKEAGRSEAVRDEEGRDMEHI